MKVFCFFLFLGAAFGKHHHVHDCVHTNHQQLTADQVILLVATDLDKDHDGSITTADVLNEFLTRYDHDDDGALEEQDFVHQWHQQYHDARDFAGYLFHELDANQDDLLTAADIPMVAAKMDEDGNGSTSVTEFTIYMKQLYTKCRA